MSQYNWCPPVSPNPFLPNPTSPITPLHWITSHAEVGEAGLGKVGIGEAVLGEADRNHKTTEACLTQVSVISSKIVIDDSIVPELTYT